MFLESLYIQGFKSFPDGQEILFHEGITGIVGPNGCGKSNVTDAVRWVLGEQSLKNLRGSRMEDMIFSGTRLRKPLASAEVRIRFDNRDHRLDCAFDTVEVTRRYYRSGESEYLLNQTPCRLKDIQTLFADTGIGRDGYSMIGQGRVEEILSERSEERRRIFDEAAGIVKYKIRKHEAELKLVRSDEDFSRLEELRQEMETRLEPLRQQAKDARRYEELWQEQEDLDFLFSAQDIRNWEEEAAQHQAFLASVSADLESLATEKADVHARREALQMARRERDAEAEKLSEHFRSASAALAGLAEASARAGERRQEAEKRLGELTKKAEQDVLQVEQFASRLASRAEHRQNLEAHRQSVLNSLQAAEAAQAANAAAASRREQAEMERRKALEAARETLFARRSAVFRLESALSSKKEELHSLQLRMDDEAANQKQRREQWRELQAKLTAEAERQQLAESSYEQARQAREAAAATLRKSEEEQSKRLVREREVRYQYDTLHRLEENREGYHPAVRALAKAGEKEPALVAGLYGAVGERLRVEARYEMASEMSLGGALHHLVTETAADASRLIQWLKMEKAGRETFLPLDRIEARSLSREERQIAQHHAGFLGTLDEFMETDPGLELLRSYLGGRILLVDTLEHALRLSDDLGKRLRVVTLEGELLNPGGSLTGGQNKKGLSGLLGRSRELAALDKELQSLEKQIAQGKERLAASKSELEQCGEREKQAQEEYAARHQEYIRQSEALHQAEVRLQEQEPALGNLQEQYQEATSFIQKLEEDQAARQSEAEAAEAAVREGSAQDGAADAELEAARKAQAEQLEQITELKVKLASTEASLSSLVELEAQVVAARDQHQADMQSRAAEESRLHVLLESLQKEEARQEKRRAQLEADSHSAEAALQELRAHRDEEEEEEKRLFSRLESLGGREKELEGRVEHARSRINSLEERASGEKNRLFETYRLSYVQILEKIAGSSLPRGGRQRLRQVREALHALPAINHAAPQDYAELQERYSTLLQQRDDIAHSRSQVSEVIRELETAMQEQFTERFGEIREAFRSTFTELFNGGDAELQLSDDSTALESDIEIKAQPPGKRLQNLRLLSGGERAMTAIALILAIFRLNPAPFCLLDEVDSALDDANVLRFAEYLKRYQEHTQFIVVTHRKGSMEAAQRLYGVTMRERGVSTVLSLALGEEGEKNGIAG